MVVDRWQREQKIHSIFSYSFFIRMFCLRILGAMNPFGMMDMGAMGAAMQDAPLADSAEMVYISSLALLKMLKHGSVVCSFWLFLTSFFRSRWRTDGSYGFNAWRICWRVMHSFLHLVAPYEIFQLHCPCCWRVCHAAKRDGCLCRSCWPCFPNQHAWNAQSCQSVSSFLFIYLNFSSDLFLDPKWCSDQYF